MLDDAAFFAVNAIIDDFLAFTASFETKFFKPVDSGKLIAIGKVNKEDGKKIEANAELFDENGNLIATGAGLFIKTKKLINEISSYKN